MEGIQCLHCQHYLWAAKCRAFPKAIPEKVFGGVIRHNKSIPGDHGIRFKPFEKDANGNAIMPAEPGVGPG